MPRREDIICPHGWQRAACARCRNRNNRSKGRAAQTEMHKLLGGTGVSPTHEESGRGYLPEYVAVEGDLANVLADLGYHYPEGRIEVQVMKVHPESKQGAQVPASLQKFLDTDWYRRALSQSARSVPVGSGARPAVWCRLAGGRKVLIIDYDGGR